MAPSRDWAVIRKELQKPVWFCVASGESLTKADCDLIPREHGIIAVNNSYQMVPDANILYACDSRWWDHYRPVFDGIKLTYSDNEQAIKVPHEDGPGLGRERMRTGNNGGYQVMNIAYLLGAKIIVLLGYDMQGKHWHPDHKGLPNGDPKSWVKRFPMLAKELRDQNVRVINCTRETALTCFERMPLEDAIEIL